MIVADFYTHRHIRIGIGTKLRNIYWDSVYLIAAVGMDVINMFNIESGRRFIPAGLKVSDMDNLSYWDAIRLLDNLDRWEIINEQE